MDEELFEDLKESIKESGVIRRSVGIGGLEESQELVLVLAEAVETTMNFREKANSLRLAAMLQQNEAIIGLLRAILERMK